VAPGATTRATRRVTSRLSYDASVRYYTNGVRIARDLDGGPKGPQEPRRPSIPDELTYLRVDAPPHFQTSAFKCVGDYQSCKLYFVSRSYLDAELGCGVAYLICVGSQLIPLAGAGKD
jgi:hypothetical protein